MLKTRIKLVAVVQSDIFMYQTVPSLFCIQKNIKEIIEMRDRFTKELMAYFDSHEKEIIDAINKIMISGLFICK